VGGRQAQPPLHRCCWRQLLLLLLELHLQQASQQQQVLLLFCVWLAASFACYSRHLLLLLLLGYLAMHVLLQSPNHNHHQQQQLLHHLLKAVPQETPGTLSTAQKHLFSLNLLQMRSACASTGSTSRSTAAMNSCHLTRHTNCSNPNAHQLLGRQQLQQCAEASSRAAAARREQTRH
jgi:hypothetical protein